MKKKPFLIIITVVILIFFLLMRYLARHSNFQKFPRFRQWLEQRRGLQQIPEEMTSEGKFPENYWSHTEIPSLTMVERLKVALKAKRNWSDHIQQADQKAQKLSADLENYIRSWLAGQADQKLPLGLLPEYIDNPKTKDWTLMKAEEAKPEQQWGVIPAHEVDEEFQKLYMLGVDHHVTYLKLIFVAPLGSKLLIEGDFPHARFLDYEILQPFDPEHPASGTTGENPEVSIVDVDIEPDPGHTNPFRPGADRRALKRHYHLTFDLQEDV